LDKCDLREKERGGRKEEEGKQVDKKEGRKKGRKEGKKERRKEGFYTSHLIMSSFSVGGCYHPWS